LQIYLVFLSISSLLRDNPK